MAEDNSKRTILPDEEADLEVTSYEVLPGITLIYNVVHMQKGCINVPCSGNIYEINHCSIGRIEFIANDYYYYLSPGDMSVSRRGSMGSMMEESHFPTSHYHGVSVLIDANAASGYLAEFLEDEKVDLEQVFRSLCGPDRCFIMRSTPSLEHIFSELYSVPGSIQKGYLKIKVLELLMFLNGLDREQEEERRSFSRNQVALAKNVWEYISENLENRITIDSLAEEFHVSATQLKNSFKGVYGVSVYAYIRSQRMKMAARLLTETDRTILDIAGQCGYDNGSKFAKAFRDITGFGPKEYRNQAK